MHHLYTLGLYPKLFNRSKFYLLPSLRHSFGRPIPLSFSGSASVHLGESIPFSGIRGLFPLLSVAKSGQTLHSPWYHAMSCVLAVYDIMQHYSTVPNLFPVILHPQASIKIIYSDNTKSLAQEYPLYLQNHHHEHVCSSLSLMVSCRGTIRPNEGLHYS